MSRKYAYLRVSKHEQGVSGLGLQAQETTALRLGNAVQVPWGDAYYPDEASQKKPATRGSWGVPKPLSQIKYPEVCQRNGFLVDVHSAYTTPLEKRPAGKRLLDVLKPGDTLIMSRIDRGFRTVTDFCLFVKRCQKEQWNLVCANPPVDLTTPNGRLTATLFAAMAEWESDIKSTRIKEALAAKKAGRQPRVEREARCPAAESEYRPCRRKIDVVGNEMLPGRVVAYIRCSHRSSVESGLGLRYSMEACCQYGDDLVAEFPQLEWHQESPVVTDPAESALSTALRNRRYGKAMYDDLKRGDHVIILRPDRVFCSIHDMSHTLIDFKARGITIHFAEMSLNLATPAGEMVLSVLVAFAQYERELAGLRSKEARAVLESQGKFPGGNGYPPFWRVVRYKKKRQLFLDGNQIATYRLLLWYLSHGYTQREALERLEILLARREGREPIPQHGVKRYGKWRNLPVAYVPDPNGMIYPLWTRNRLKAAAAAWPDAQAKWRELRAEDRRLLREWAQEAGFARPTPTKAITRLKRLKRVDVRAQKRQPALGVG